jgi:hypothetical protein
VDQGPKAYGHGKENLEMMKNRILPMIFQLYLSELVEREAELLRTQR